MSANSLVLEPNPLFIREARVRWRGRAFVVMFAYIALLGLAIGSIYQSHYRQANYGNAFQSMAYLGHSLFLNVTWMQTLGWFLLAPALTATSIAAERELGLLESLQMSPLSAWSIVGGKLLGVLVFITLVLLAAQPITAICFLLGGVSPQEFLVASAVQFMTAVTGATIGLCCSAWSRRTSTAMTWTWAVILLWGIGSWASFFLPVNWFSYFFGKTNPVMSLVALIEPNLMRPRTIGGFIGSFPLLEPWMICLLFEGFLSTLLFWLTVRGVRKPLPEPYWIESATAAAVPMTASSGTASPTAHYNAATSPLDCNLPTESRWELPLTGWLRFGNPILQREMRAKFRWRKLPAWNVRVIVAVGLYLLYWYLRALRGLILDPATRQNWWLICFLGLIVIMIATTIMGASGFTGERQSGTWESLALSHLRPGQIILAKMAAPLTACFVYSIPLWPLMLACLIPMNEQTRLSGGFRPRHEIPVDVAITTLIIMAAAGWCCLAWGLWISWRAKRTATAAGWAIGLLVGVLVMMPGFLLSMSSASRALENFFNLWHPFFALINLSNRSWRQDTIPTGIVCAALQFGIGCFLLGNLLRAMRYGGRERDSRVVLE